MWIAQHKALTAGLVIGGFVLYRVAKNAGAAQGAADAQAQYSGPSIIGAPGPVVSNAGASSDGGVSSTAATTAAPVDLATFFSTELAKAKADASVANVASGTTTNVDLINSFLTKINSGKLSGQALDLQYNDSGQVTSFGMNKLIAPQTAVEQATSTAKVTTTNLATAGQVAATTAKQAIDAINAAAKKAIAEAQAAATVTVSTKKIQDTAAITLAKQQASTAKILASIK